MGAIKVKEINLERGMPFVDEAMNKLVNDLTTGKMAGCKAAVIIHGYGSSGAGGAIKAATKKKLKDPALRGILRAVVSGEEWISEKKVFLDVCPQLGDFQRHIEGNKGITVVLIK